MPHSRQSQLGMVTALACFAAALSVLGAALVLTEPGAARFAGEAHMDGTRVDGKHARLLADEATSRLPAQFDRKHVRASSAEFDAVGVLSRSFAVGDRITVGDGNGLKRVLVVAKVTRRALGLDADKSTPLPIAIIEARDVDRPEAAPVRLIIEEAPAASTSDQPAEFTQRVL